MVRGNPGEVWGTREDPYMLKGSRLLGARESARGSGLDRLIPPEIKGDAFHRAIERVAQSPGLRNVLEIGSSSGEGSTSAFLAGMSRNPEPGLLHCLEVSRVRFAALAERYAGHPLVRCYNLSSVRLDRFPRAAEVEAFYRRERSPLRKASLETVLRWLQQDIDYLVEHQLGGDGIRRIRELNGIDEFDAVLIDGSEFTGKAELEEVYGARFLLLDDIRTYKNHENWNRLRTGRDYRLVESSPRVRNGYAVFERVR